MQTYLKVKREGWDLGDLVTMESVSKSAAQVEPGWPRRCRRRRRHQWWRGTVKNCPNERAMERANERKWPKNRSNTCRRRRAEKTSDALKSTAVWRLLAPFTPLAWPTALAETCPNSVIFCLISCFAVSVTGHEGYKRPRMKAKGWSFWRPLQPWCAPASCSLVG